MRIQYTETRFVRLSNFSKEPPPPFRIPGTCQCLASVYSTFTQDLAPSPPPLLGRYTPLASIHLHSPSQQAHSTPPLLAGLSDLASSSTSSAAASWRCGDLLHISDPAYLEAVLGFAGEFARLALLPPSELLSPHALELYPGAGVEAADPWWLGYTTQVG